MKKPKKTITTSFVCPFCDQLVLSKNGFPKGLKIREILKIAQKLQAIKDK